MPEALRKGIQEKKTLLYLLLGANLAGFLFSLYYYRTQLLTEPLYLLPFVPDSGTAVLLFATAFYLQSRGRTGPALNHLAGALLVTYGTWTVVVLATNPGYYFTPLFGPWFYFNLLLIALPHSLMTLQALLLEYEPTPVSTLSVAALLLFNWWLDYGLGLHTRIPEESLPVASAAALLLIIISVPTLPLLQRKLEDPQT